jgi:hypothetical protein
MDIAIDTNVIVRDLWLRSQATRLLLDYVDRTDSRLLIGEVVIKEAEAYFKRLIEKNLSSVESAVRNASRHSLVGLPDIDHEKIFDETYANWRANFDTILRKGTGVIYGTDSEILDEAIQRCIERIPPCKETGEGMRDVIIWLSFLTYCRERLKTYHGYHVAFISGNTRDFADINNPDEFKPQLLEDIEETEVRIDYYPSLDAFIESQAKPISHVTVDWVKERINFEQIRSMLEKHLEGNNYSWRKPSNYFTISDSELREPYEISGIPQIYQLDIDLEGVMVFEFDDAHIETSLNFFVYAEADIDCEFSDSKRIYYHDDHDFLRSRSFDERTLACFAELRVFISATIEGEKIEILEIEDIDRA